VLKRLVLVSLAFILILGGISLTSCGTPATPSSSGLPTTASPASVQETFSTVIKMNGKELTLGAPTISHSDYSEMVTVVVKNTGNVRIILGEVEIANYDNLRTEEVNNAIVIKELSPGDVQTLYAKIDYRLFHGSFKVKVKRLE